MIYKLSAINMPLAMERGGIVTGLNTDGVHALIKELSDTTDIEIAEAYEDLELNTLLGLPEWSTLRD